MKLIQTIISRNSRRMRYADNPDPNVATSRMDLRFPLTALKQPNTGGKALDDPGSNIS